MNAGLILAGGRSRRFGLDKAAAILGGQSLLERTYLRLTGPCGPTAVSARGDSVAAALASELGIEVLSDEAGLPNGPLAGVLAGLTWARAQGAKLMVTLPCDTPLAPPDMVAALIAAAGAGKAAMARSPSGPQPLCAAWPTVLAGPLRACLEDGRHPAVHSFLIELGAQFVDFPDDADFLNINTQADLAAAQRRLDGGT